MSGRGKGGAKRHRKVLRDNIQGITKPAIRRLARQGGLISGGGVKRISGAGRDCVCSRMSATPEVLLSRKMEKYARAAAENAGLPQENFEFLHAVGILQSTHCYCFTVGEDLPLANSSMDAVIGTLVLCSVTDVKRTLGEVKRVLKPGGIYVFFEWEQRASLASDHTASINRVMWSPDGSLFGVAYSKYIVHIYSFAANDMRNMIRALEDDFKTVVGISSSM
ncbi:hypothetical protein Droror1_Dr00023325 [Drosera rotundifolia]